MIGSVSLGVLAGFSALLVMTAGTAEAEAVPPETKNPTRLAAPIYGPKSHPVAEMSIGGIRGEGADGSGYLYAGAGQRVNNDGTWADIAVAKPYLAPADDHALAEIAVESTDGQQIDFPDSLWGGRYTSSGVVQWFGEVSAASTTRTCTDMGNGQPASSSSAASFKIGFFNGASVKTDTYVTNSSFYSIRKQDSQALRFGGGGAC